ncbi:MAG: bacillithiol biosynthesis cysteine-adding enzyme BshC [Melioribacteraceae bacterium]|nr:bacillithiol biosynthesis cysteine-adding enzyme BshC [Melioribacteraceae bacterium]MCF8263794.1 bacillithiol biosynthesis cysteine-adding enzyme BshC [Melioribacteraceae bacterium]MCF8431298.1 bacillithiol biosynthesis cysteine-adding enzyme BshC [Melioribacteraceae bacterium]
MFINFSDLPGNVNLFLDYLYEFENVKRFFKKDFRDRESYLKLFEDISSKECFHRNELRDCIKKQYANTEVSSVTNRNIESLSAVNTIAVVTGQQLGLFGGPLYTIYKTITAIKLCKSLKEKYSEYNFVPIFWLEGEDHDYEEVRSTNIIDKTNSLLNIEYSDGLEEETNRGSIGKLHFNANVNESINKLEEALRDSDFKESVLQLVEAYKEGNSFKFAFRKLILDLFDEFGLILFDPQDDGVKKLLKPVFEREIKDFMSHSIDTVEVSAELEDVYHAQVKVKPINIFINDGEGRFLLEPRENNMFSLKGKRIKYTEQELLDKLENEPETFSPNVLLRPICQDFLFPTAFYIGGPGEISYFPQVIPLYKHFEITQPIIYPRSSITLIEKSASKVFDKHDLKFSDFYDEKELNQKVINKLSQINIEQEFNNLESEIENLYRNLKEKLELIDKTLIDITDKTKDRSSQGLEQLKNKVRKAEENRNENALRQIEKTRLLLFPNNNLQERELNFIYFAHKYGRDLLKFLMDEISITKFEHQLIEL